MANVYEEIENKYLISLRDLKCNNKLVINTLSILAEANLKHGQVIVDAIAKHITKISPEEKLPALYLIDSIVKNVGGEYRTLFSRVIVNIFCGVFKDVDENVRRKMFPLRRTWKDIFPITKLNDLDVKTQILDPNWPITAIITPAIEERSQEQMDLLKSKKRKMDLEIAGIVQQLISPTPTSAGSSITVMPTSIVSVRQSSEWTTLAEPALKKRKADKVDKSIENKENVDLRTQLSQEVTHLAVVQAKLSKNNEISNWATVKANPQSSNKLNLDSSRPISGLTNPGLQSKSNQGSDIDSVIDWSVASSLKPRQQTNIDALYSGMSCSNCSVRFPPEQTTKYSQHLDWHFRENRRNRDSARKANSRGWYYNVAGWIQYEETEDVDEREKSWFEIQQSKIDVAYDDLAQRNESPVPSCIAGLDDVDKTCDMCHDRFDTFFNDDDEEWHLRNALRMDKKTFHPICFEDYNKSSLKLDKSDVKYDFEDDSANKVSMEVEPNVTDALRVDKTFFDPICFGEYNESTLTLNDVKCDVDDDKLSMNTVEPDDTVDDDTDDDDTDDVILLPQEEPVIIEILDDDETPISSVSTSDIVEHADSMSGIVNNESIGNELDVQILVPKTSVVEKLDESLQISVKIKEEPKDDGFENIGTFKDVETLQDIETFDDVGTLEEATIDVDVSTQSHQTTASIHPSQVSMITSVDDNVQWQPVPIKIGANKIKINLKTNVLKNAIKSSQDVGKQPPKISLEKCKTMPGVNVSDETSALCCIM